MHSIKFRLLAGLSLCIVIPFVVIYLIIHSQVSDQAVKAFSTAAGNEIKQVDKAIQILLDEAKKNVAMIAASPLNDGINESVTSYVGPEEKPRTPEPGDVYGQAMSPTLQWIQSAHPSYDSVYIGTKWGGNVLSNTKGMRKGYDPRQRPWWGVALKDTSRAQISKAYKGTTGDPMISVVKAYVRGGEVTAVAALDLTLKELSGMMETIKLGRTGYVLLVQDDGTVIANPRNDKMNFQKLSEWQDSTFMRLFEMGAGQAEVELNGVDYLAQVSTSDGLGWRFIGLIEKSEVLADVDSLLMQLGLIMGVSLLLILGVLWLFMDRMVVRALTRVLAFLKRISGADYSERFNERRSDEIGQIFNALDEMAETLASNIEEITARTNEAQDKARAAEQAVAEAEEARRQAELAKSEGMAAAAQQLEAVVAGVTAASEEISHSSGEIRQGAQIQSQRIAETATAMEEMNSTVLEVARNSGEAATVSSEARERASQGAAIVHRSREAMLSTQERTIELKQSMDNLGRQAESIGAIMTVIEDIADQTNLLALNAAIEAARAGDAGRGFAVVADEVRKLAEKTMTATQEVGASIKSIQAGARENMASVDNAVAELQSVVDLTEESRQVLSGIVERVEVSADQIQGIATAAEEQSATSEEINRSIEEINRITEETSNGVGQTADAVHELTEQMLQLGRLVQELKAS